MINLGKIFKTCKIQVDLKNIDFFVENILIDALSY